MKTSLAGLAPLLSLSLLLGCAASAPRPADSPASSGRLCQSASDCGAQERCQAPELANWNHCGPPQKRDCPAGFTGDDCGACYRTCQQPQDCQSGQSCRDGLCLSPNRCLPVRLTPT